MQKIYHAASITEAHIVAGMLNAHDIQPHVGGHYLQGGVGELGVADNGVIYVADEDVKQAKALILQYENNEMTSEIADTDL